MRIILVAITTVTILSGCSSNVSEEEKNSEPSKFKKLSCLGQGGGGSVALVEDQTCEKYARKCGEKSEREEYLREFAILKVLNSLPNGNMFPTVVDFMDRESLPCIVMEPLGRDVRRIRESMPHRMPTCTIMALGLRMLETLTSLHKSGWAHGDAHLSNWMTPVGGSFDPSSLKLIDFGWAAPLSPALKRHDLRTIALAIRFAHNGKWLFACPVAFRHNKGVDMSHKDLCDGLTDRLCKTVSEIYSLPEVDDIDTQYNHIKALLQLASTDTE